MGNLQPLRSQIAALKSFDVEKEVREIVIKNREVLADLQAEQWAKGKRSDGKDILPGYAPFTIAHKKEFGVGLGAVTSHVTFFDTGELYASLFAIIKNQTFDINSNSFKFEKIKKRSGQKVVGLSDESKRRFAEEVFLPQFKAVFEAKTGLKFS